ncbi:MAG: hypothetical protein JRM86_06480 [Nitrososphaerota archaeon]|nr:hypothetical protein [Nitrososphaerota archaeon]
MSSPILSFTISSYSWRRLRFLIRKPPTGNITIDGTRFPSGGAGLRAWSSGPWAVAVRPLPPASTINGSVFLARRPIR